jgi:hypothetical protein
MIKGYPFSRHPRNSEAKQAGEWFAAVEIIQLAADKDWLHKATNEISKHWRQKRERRQSSLEAATATGHNGG